MRRIFLILACSLTGATFASAGQISVINPPNIVVPTPTVPSPTVAPEVSDPTAAPGVGSAGEVASEGASGGSPLMEMQSFDVGQLSVAQRQEAVALMQQMMNRGGLSPMQCATLRRQLAEMGVGEPGSCRR